MTLLITLCCLSLFGFHSVNALLRHFDKHKNSQTKTSQQASYHLPFPLIHLKLYLPPSSFSLSVALRCGTIAMVGCRSPTSHNPINNPLLTLISSLLRLNLGWLYSTSILHILVFLFQLHLLSLWNLARVLSWFWVLGIFPYRWSFLGFASF